MWILKRVWHFFLDLLETFVVSAAIFVIIYMFLFQPHQVDGRSMEPNFHHGEYILTDKLSYRFTDPSRGDVIVFQAPQDERLDFIKRIIGVAGDEVMVENGKVVLNGKELEENYIFEPGEVPQGRFLREGVPVQVPNNQYLVMGDNRKNSSDSREWGFINRSDIVGRAFFVYWPFSEIGLIDTNEIEVELGAVMGTLDSN